MTEPIPAADPVPYRSLSGLALSGLILSGLFSGWLAIAAIVALRTGAPLLIQPGWLLVPLLGAVVSALGWLQIHCSEGSRVGVRPAQWGLLLGVLATLGYGAWYAMTELPLRLQARDFTEAWFDDLRRSVGDERTGFVAFWCTLHPRSRDASFGELNNPDDREALLKDPKKFQALFLKPLRIRHLDGERGQKGELPLFFEQEVVRLVRQTGTEAEIEPLGVRDWAYVGGSEPGYRVEQAYRVRTADGVFEVAVPVLSLDADRRRWRVLLGETVVTQREYTPRGRFLDQLRQDSYRFAFDWVRKLGEGPLKEVAIEVEPRIMGAHSNRTKDLEPEMKALFRPGGGADKAIQLAPFGSNATSPYEVYPDSSTLEELIFYHPFEARIGSRYRIAGMIAVGTSNKKLLAGLDSPAAIVLPEGTSAQRNKRWRLVRLRLSWGSEIAPPRQQE